MPSSCTNQDLDVGQSPNEWQTGSGQPSVAVLPEMIAAAVSKNSYADRYQVDLLSTCRIMIKQLFSNPPSGSHPNLGYFP